MQYCLQNLLDEKYELYGYYFGVREDSLIEKDNCLGLYLNGENDEKKRILLASMTALIEIFFSAPHGSVQKYDENGQPLLGEYKSILNDSDNKLLEEIQTGALMFVKDFSESYMAKFVSYNANDLLNGLRELACNPQKEELHSFGNYEFQMGTGFVRAADPDCMLKYIVCPRKLIFDFSNSNWKVAFMKRLFKVRLPYYKLFEFIYKKKGK